MEKKEVEKKTGIKKFDIICANTNTIPHKWDICLMNPPYDKTLHLKFLEKVNEVTDKVITIQPVRWLQDPLCKYKKTTDYKKYENSISKHIKDIETYTSDEATKLFHADFTMNVGIYVINTNEEYDTYKSLKYNKMGENFDFIDDVIKQIHSEGNFKKLKKEHWNKDLHNFVPLNNMTGENLKRCQPTNVVKEWTRPYKNGEDYEYDKKHKSGVARGKIENDVCLVFDTIDEAKNLFNSFTKCNFTRFYMSFITTDIHIYHEFMPFMDDYTHPWTDEMFYKHFNISKENQEKIEKYAKQIWDRSKYDI